MKRFRSLAALLALVVCTSGASAQITLNTYYVTPPINGCDGVWAFGPYSALWSACPGPYTWFFDPPGCVDGSQWGQPIPLNVVGDTILMDLCSQPCDFLFYADTGLCMVCICGPLIPTTVADADPGSDLSIGPNPVPASSPTLQLHTTRSGPLFVQVLDLAGLSLLQVTVHDGQAELDLSGIPAGAYLLLLRDEHGRMSTHKFAIE
ncbi:MAG TPA: T9SS type A sorting domain-containing protein [Flavobacteriales bacterium]|nr:T9SS type A sorting domain-containing protein [Flavobacteriales bacterium]HMR26758.1 T9SS type A sorting domain-containing protein [Flavobacteriales bacterium]